MKSNTMDTMKNWDKYQWFNYKLDVRLEMPLMYQSEGCLSKDLRNRLNDSLWRKSISIVNRRKLINLLRNG